MFLSGKGLASVLTTHSKASQWTQQTKRNIPPHNASRSHTIPRSPHKLLPKGSNFDHAAAEAHPFVSWRFFQIYLPPWTQEWRCGKSHPGRFTCKADALSLSYIHFLKKSLSDQTALEFSIISECRPCQDLNLESSDP